MGEIIVRTPSLMKGYWEKSRRPSGSWSTAGSTGDLSQVDADGYLYITGRIKDVIVTGAGKNVYPMDLEAIYRAIPEIEEICASGCRAALPRTCTGSW